MQVGVRRLAIRQLNANYKIRLRLEKTQLPILVKEYASERLHTNSETPNIRFKIVARLLDNFRSKDAGKGKN